MEIYRKADAWLVAKLNDLYLWALDWTGVYIGTVTFLVGAEQVAFMIHRQAMWLGAIMLLLVLLNAGVRYYQQAMGLIAAHNAAAEWFEKSIVRTFLVWWGISFLPVDIIKMQWWSLFDSILSIAILYLWCCKIRERQKKDFKLPSLATQGAP